MALVSLAPLILNSSSFLLNQNNMHFSPELSRLPLPLPLLKLPPVLAVPYYSNVSPERDKLATVEMKMAAMVENLQNWILLRKKMLLKR